MSVFYFERQTAIPLFLQTHKVCLKMLKKMTEEKFSSSHSQRKPIKIVLSRQDQLLKKKIIRLFLPDILYIFLVKNYIYLKAYNMMFGYTYTNIYIMIITVKLIKLTHLSSHMGLLRWFSSKESTYEMRPHRFNL